MRASFALTPTRTPKLSNETWCGCGRIVSARAIGGKWSVSARSRVDHEHGRHARGSDLHSLGRPGAPQRESHQDLHAVDPGGRHAPDAAVRLDDQGSRGALQEEGARQLVVRVEEHVDAVFVPDAVRQLRSARAYYDDPQPIGECGLP